MGQLRVMTWNVENLFDVGDEDGPETQAQLDAKIAALAAVINDQEPHVVGRSAQTELATERARATQSVCRRPSHS